MKMHSCFVPEQILFLISSSLFISLFDTQFLVICTSLYLPRLIKISSYKHFGVNKELFYSRNLFELHEMSRSKKDFYSIEQSLYPKTHSSCLIEKEDPLCTLFIFTKVLEQYYLSLFASFMLYWTKLCVGKKNLSDIETEPQNKPFPIHFKFMTK